MTTVDCIELYKYLACNDTIHDFGKGERGENIVFIIREILKETLYIKYTPFGDNRNITMDAFERSVEEFVLYNCDLPGIPESVLAQSPYLTSPNLGDSEAKDVKEVAIYRFINKNKNVNYGIKLFSYQVLGLTDIQRKNIFEEPSNIDPAISFFSTIIIEDQYNPSQTGIRKLFNWMEDELNADANVTSLLQSSQDDYGNSDIKKNKIGNFLINTFFYAGKGSDYKGFIYNKDAVSGNLKCAFPKFTNNVLGAVKDTANYGDSAITAESGAEEDEDDSSSKKNKGYTCGRNKKTKIGDNLFDLVVGYFNVEQKEKGKLSIEVTENPDHLPSLFPASNGEPKGRKVYFFSNNFFTKNNFTIAYVETRDKNWKPYFQPYNFSLCIYSGEKSPGLMQQIQNNPENGNLIGSAAFSSGDNGPSVVYLKQLIIAVNNSNQQSNLENNIRAVIPEGKILNINELIIDIYKKLSSYRDHGTKKNIIIKLLLDLKRCGDFEQVDAIRMIQDQNEGSNNRFGLQDILFTTGDRLCSLYSRFRNTNVQFFVANTQRYYLYRQPYIYPSEEVRLQIDQQNIFNELKQKAIRARSFMQKINILKDFDIGIYYSNNGNLKNLVNSKLSFVKLLFEYIYLFQKNRLIYLKQIVDSQNMNLDLKIDFCKKIGESTFEQVNNKDSSFYFDDQSTNLKFKYPESSNPIDCNALINNFYYLASSEAFSDITSDEEKYLDMDIIKGKFKISKVIPETNTVLLFDFLPSDNITEKLDLYYFNFIKVYNLLLEAYNNIKITGSKRIPKVPVIAYLQYSSIVITFLQLCNLIFGSVNIINEKISNLVNINNTLKVLLIQNYEQYGSRSLPSLTTPQYSVDLTTITEVEQPAMPTKENLFEPSKDTFADIVNDIKAQVTFQKVEENKIQINETKQLIKKQKQQQQKEKQEKKELKKKNKMLRAVKKIQALNAISGPSDIKNKLIDKEKSFKQFKQGSRSSDRISIKERKSSLRSRSASGTAPPLIEGGGKIQKGGGIIDTLIGNKLEELYADVNIIAFMNQIYSDSMPYELLLILLTEFNFEYSGVSDASGNMIPLSDLPEDLSETDPKFFPMVLSRGEYLLKFQTELSNLIKNENLGLSEENKTILESFTEVVTTVVTEATEETEATVVTEGTEETEDTEEKNVEYNTEELEDILASDQFNLTPIIEQMENIVLTKKNVPCFLLGMNSNQDTKNAISNYLNGMSETWLTILNNINKDDNENSPLKGINIFQIPINDSNNADIRNAFENMHLITILLTIHSTGTGCELRNPFPDNPDNQEIANYLSALNDKLDLNTYCNPGNNVGVRQSARFYGDLAIIKDIILTIRKIKMVDLQIIIIYVLSILGAVLFDVTKLYFPNKEKTYRRQILNIIRPQAKQVTGEEETVYVSNEEIFRFLTTIVGNILILLPNNEKLTCEEEIYENEENIDNPEIELPTMVDTLDENEDPLEVEEDDHGTELNGGRKKTKRNKKHSKNRSLRFK